MTNMRYSDNSMLKRCDKYCGNLYVADDEEGTINLKGCGNCPFKHVLASELDKELVFDAINIALYYGKQAFSDYLSEYEGYVLKNTFHDFMSNLEKELACCITNPSAVSDMFMYGAIKQIISEALSEAEETFNSRLDDLAEMVQKEIESEDDA